MNPGRLLLAFMVSAALVTALRSCVDEADERTALQDQNAFVSAVDDLWFQALHLGADQERWPEVVFAENLVDVLARTRCERPRPIIEINARLLSQYRWYYQNLTVPHEMAHVMVCLAGSPDDWRDHHGDAWAGWVRLLVPRERAEEVLAEQFEAPTMTGDKTP